MKEYQEVKRTQTQISHDELSGWLTPFLLAFGYDNCSKPKSKGECETKESTEKKEEEVKLEPEESTTSEPKDTPSPPEKKETLNDIAVNSLLKLCENLTDKIPEEMKGTFSETINALGPEFKAQYEKEFSNLCSVFGLSQTGSTTSDK